MDVPLLDEGREPKRLKDIKYMWFVYYFFLIILFYFFWVAKMEEGEKGVGGQRCFDKYQYVVACSKITFPQ